MNAHGARILSTSSPQPMRLGHPVSSELPQSHFLELLSIPSFH